MTFVKKALGESYEESMRKENQSSYEERQTLIMDQKQLKNLDVEMEKQNQAQKIRHETERTRAEFISRQEEIIKRGDSGKIEEEIQKLREAQNQLKISEEIDKKEKEKMKRQTKIRDKLQADVDKRTARLEKKEREIGAKETRFYKAISLENIKE